MHVRNVLLLGLLASGACSFKSLAHLQEGQPAHDAAHDLSAFGGSTTTGAPGGRTVTDGPLDAGGGAMGGAPDANLGGAPGPMDAGVGGAGVGGSRDIPGMGGSAGALSSGGGAGTTGSRADIDAGAGSQARGGSGSGGLATGGGTKMDAGAGSQAAGGSTGATGTGGARPDAGAGSQTKGGSISGGSAAGGAISTGGTGVSSVGLVAYYPCDQASGTKLPDLSGNGHDAVLSGGYSIVSGKDGNALDLQPASRGHAVVPRAALAGATDITIATWVYLKSQTDWARVWDFGQNTTYNMFVTPRNGTGGVLHFAITKSGASGVQVLNDVKELPVGRWTHVAIVLGKTECVLYVNGQKGASNSSLTLRPKDLGDQSSNFIGRSQYTADPYLDAKVDEFRVYNRALSAVEVAALAGAQ